MPEMRKLYTIDLRQIFLNVTPRRKIQNKANVDSRDSHNSFEFNSKNLQNNWIEKQRKQKRENDASHDHFSKVFKIKPQETGTVLVQVYFCIKVWNNCKTLGPTCRANKGKFSSPQPALSRPNFSPAAIMTTSVSPRFRFWSADTRGGKKFASL